MERLTLHQTTAHWLHVLSYSLWGVLNYSQCELGVNSDDPPQEAVRAFLGLIDMCDGINNLILDSMDTEDDPVLQAVIEALAPCAGHFRVLQAAADNNAWDEAIIETARAVIKMCTASVDAAQRLLPREMEDFDKVYSVKRAEEAEEAPA